MIQLISPGGEVLTSKLRTKLGNYKGLAEEIKSIGWEGYGACLTEKSGGYDKELADYSKKYAEMLDAWQPLAGFSYYKTSSWSLFVHDPIVSFTVEAAKVLALNLDSWMAASLKEGWPEMTKEAFYDKVMQEALDYYHSCNGTRGKF